MDQFTADYLANLTADLTARVLEAAGRQVREKIAGTEKEQALESCLQAGIVALLATTSAQVNKDELDLLSDIFQEFFNDPDVGKELEQLRRGNLLQRDALTYLFEQAGFQAETLPGLDFSQGLTAFEAAFIAAATDKPALQGIIQTNQLLAQTRLQGDMLATMRELVAFLRRAQPNTVGIRVNQITAQSVTSGGDIVYVLTAPTPGLEECDTTNLLHCYLEELAHEANRLPWTSVEREYAHSEGGEDIGLAEVYTELDTTKLENVECEEELRQFLSQLEKGEAHRIPAQEMVNQEARLLILGDPGSGKSTFVNHLAYTMAQAMMAPNPDFWIEKIEPWDHGALIPTRIELRSLATQVEGELKGSAKHILGYLHEMLKEWQLGKFWSSLDKIIRGKEDTLLVLLDGLDEVPSAARKTVVEAVQDFADRYRQHRYVVTCRPYAYVGQPWPLQSFREVTLAPFDEEQINHFITIWYRELARRGRLSAQDADGQAARLQEAVQQRDLLGLAQRPLLLTVMTLLNTFRGQLPQDRTQLYADAVDLLLHRWEKRGGGETGILESLDIPGLKMSDLEAGLYKVAFQAHCGTETAEGTADVGEGDLREWLASYLGDNWDKAGEFVDYIRERAGLLICRKTESYTFPHRTFQEFMAACHLVGTPDYPTEAARLVKEEPDRWREVFVLAAGHAARTHRLGQAIAAVNALCPLEVESVTQPDAANFRRSQLGGEALREIGLVGVRREEAGRAALERIQDWLSEAIQADQTLEPRERAEAGDVLARLGDPRPGVGLIPETNLPDIEWCLVPAGPFWMGEHEGEHLNKSLGYDYWIGRYPVTVAQFKAFVDSSGHEPAEEDSLRDLPNRPVRWVTWYEALAFCGWLTDQLREWADAPEPVRSLLRDEGWVVTLPSEAEWEKAARGGIEIPRTPTIVRHNVETPYMASLQPNPYPKRRYPWESDEPDPNRANFDYTGIGTASAAGCFPGGVSPYGGEDMSGNVWEWTRSIYRDYPYQPEDGRENLQAGDDEPRVLRGGSFIHDEWLVRCASRGRGDPDSLLDYLGFRVVLAAPI